MVPVAEENGPCLCIAGVHVADPVDFLVYPGIFMPFDHAALVIVYGGACHKPRLGPAVHGLGIDIESGDRLLYQMSAGHFLLQHIPGLFVDTVIIGADPVRKLGLGPVDPQKGKRPVLYDSTGFRPAVYVIRKSSDLILQP